jgi:glutaredoxin
MRIVLYSRRGCHLCEQAEDMLAAHAPEIAVIDIDASADLAREFGTRVPVVEVDGRVLIEGRFDEPELLARLAGARGS